MDDLAVRQVLLLRHFVRALDDQLHDEDEQEDRGRLEEQRQVDAVTEARPQPGDSRGGEAADGGANDEIRRLVQLHEQQRRFHAFPADHQQREEKHAGERRDSGLHRRCLQPSLDVAFHAAAGAPHVDGHPAHRHGGDERERTVEPFLIQRVEQQVAAERAHGDGDADAPVHCGGERRTTRLAEVRQADRDDQKSFETLAKRDDKRLEHDLPILDNETESQDEN